MSFFKDFHSEVKVLAIICVLAVGVSIGAIFILNSLSNSTPPPPTSITTPSPIPTPRPTPTPTPQPGPPQDQELRKEDLTISIYKTEYHHDETIFEPVEFTVSNNSLNSIFFYQGCAIQFPSVFRESSQDKITVLLGQPV